MIFVIIVVIINDTFMLGLSLSSTLMSELYHYYYDSKHFSVCDKNIKLHCNIINT